MTQHTQPVVASQHQQHHHQQQQQQQQQQQHQQQTSTPQQQQTTMIPNTNNSNASNNISTTSSSSTNNNQTQTVAIQHQQHLNNNNANNTYQSQQQNATSVQMFNPQLQSTNVYVPTHSMPVHHHPQHHHQPGAMYQTMIPAAIPSNVYVNNVTANVNLHGWAHTVPHGAWVHPSGAPPYIHGDLPQEQGASVIQPMGAMPVTLPAANALAGPVINANATVISGGTRGSRRGRGRGGASGSRRGDYNMQRYPPSEGSPAPQQSGQMNQQDMQQQQQGQQPAEAPQIMTALPPSYVPHPQYAAHASQYPYGYQTYFAPQQHMIHPGQSAAAQQATGTPLYFSHMPVYNGPHMYNYGYYMPPVINQSEYPYGEEVEVGGSLGDERQTVDEGGAILWHQQTMYPDEYGMSPADMHAVASDEINHNPSLVSANETPSMLSPNYQPMYDQITQQMGVMQIYEDPQMGQMQVIHPQAGVPQMEEELSECGSQPSTQMQIVPPIQMVPITSAVPQPTMALPAATSEHIVHQQTPHLIPVTGIATIIPADGTSLTPNTTPQHQINQQHGDNTIDSNLQTYENVSNKQPSESATSLNEEIVQQPADNVTIEYQQQQLQIHTQSVLVEAVQSDDLCNNKILSTDIQEPQESRTKTTRVTEAADNNSTDVAIETVTTNVVSNKQQQPVYQQQQQIQEKHYKQQQQYVAKQQSVPQQQQYQHQQLQTQPMPAQQQQEVQATPQQPQQPTHYQPQHQNQHNQQQQQHHQSQQQTTYENRKSSQMYNQQHQSRGRKYDYHHVHGSSSSNDNSSHQQQQSQQTTKTMSWTNSSQHKKSTNTVAVTATPTSSHSSGSYNKQSNNANLSSSHTHATRTYTNQQHHNYQQQQNYHFQQQQQQQQQPQTRNYGAMKMPSSPISSAPNTMERKTSQSSDVGKAPAQQQQSQTQSTSTASTTAAPHQFQQQQQSQQTSTNDNVQTHTSSSTANTNAATTATAISSKQQHYPPGFATKKHNFSNQGQSGGTPNIATSSTGSSYAVDTPTTPAINLAPPVTNTTPAAPSTPSWASLFASSSNTSSTGISSAAAPINNLSATSTSITASSSTSVAFSKKPVAKVAPYEGLTPVTPPPPVVTPGTLSYSAASAQNLPPPLSNTSTTAATANKSNINEQQLQRNLLANLDEYSLKFAEFLTKYKSDWSNISLRPRGLTNRSNYCYINSILQALLGFSPLYNLIRSIPKQAANFCEVKTPTVNAMITFMSNFSNLPSGLRLRNAKGGKGNKDDLGSDLQCDPAFEPTEIYKLWNDSREEHVEGRQEDAEEFLSYILNKLNDEMLEVIKLIAKPNTEPNNQNEPPEEDGDVWQMICNNRNKGSVTRQTDFGCTPLSDIFRGELRSRLQREGEHPTDVIQPFFTLQLNIEKAASVKEALEILVGRDQLEGVTGSKSKQEVVAWQQMNLEKLPPILILHLKWFDYRSDGCTKILKKVEFPVELKIDAKILASKKYSQKQRAYRLFAVVYHDGKEATKGHYITDVYHTGYGSWLRYDDSSVKPVSENHVLLPRTPRVPYLLCYRRSDTIPQQSNNNQNNSSTGNNNSSGNTQTSSGK